MSEPAGGGRVDRGAAIGDHLQAAARELIAAARAALEVADELVNDPARVLGLIRGPRASVGDGEPAQIERIVVEDGRTPEGSTPEG